MADKIIENNQVSIMGKISTEFTFSHQVFGEGFYTLELLVKRLSDSEDRIPLMVSERLVDVTQDYVGEYIQVHGQFRSYNRHEEKRNRLVLSVFVRELSFVEEEDDSLTVNQIFLDGYICKPPVYRKHLWEERLQISCWLSIVRMESLTTYPAYAGEEMHAMHQLLRWADMC